jgi:sodium/bile acid cotransporter 7
VLGLPEKDLLIQTSTFLVFPVLGLCLMKLGKPWMSPDLLLGYFYLCALPSTVSSSVALTVAAKGNVPVALFNATLSSLLGVVLTPMWITWAVGLEGQSMAAWPVVVDLLIWVILPLVAGQLSRPWFSTWAVRHKAQVNVVDRLTILTLVYTSFSDSVQQGIWTQYGISIVLQALAVCGVLFLVVYRFTQFMSRVLGLPEKDRIAAVLCGSKKTLASGVPMAHLIFGANPALGVVLIPLMLYHPLQLAVGGILAQRWGARTPEP